MLVFINGNSGRDYGPISDGARSERGNIVWVRKQKVLLNDELKDGFGFGNAEFEKDKLTYKFYELSSFNNKTTNNSTIDSNLAFTFNVNFNEMSNLK